MADSLAVNRYARALLNLAEERGQLKEADLAMEQAAQIVDRHPEIRHLVLNSTISADEKEDFLGKVFPESFNRLVLDFLKVLVRKKRFRNLKDIQQVFRRLYEIRQGIKEVTVITAVALSPENEDRLTKMLAVRLKAEIKLVTRVDASLLGGMILQFDGNEINGSYKSRLNEARQILSE